MQCKSWIGTSYEDSMNMTHVDISYARWQREKCPTTNREHFQFFVHFSRKKRLLGVRSILGMTVHVEPSNDPVAAIAYCCKEETRIDGPWEVGMNPHAVKESVMASLKRQRVVELLEAQPTLWRSVKALMEIKNMLLGPRVRGPELVILLTGKTGTGKTKIAQRIAEFVGNTYYKNNTNWWNGYEQQELIVWDEFRGYDLAEMLSVINYIPHQVQTKGGAVHLNSKAMIFTSNLNLNQMYGMQDELSINAIKRRIIEITV